MRQNPARERNRGISKPAAPEKFTHSGDVHDQHRLREEGRGIPSRALGRTLKLRDKNIPGLRLLPNTQGTVAAQVNYPLKQHGRTSARSSLKQIASGRVHGAPEK